MYPVSPEFKLAVRGPHHATVRAEVWRGGTFLRSLEIVDGSVDVDSRRSQRRTCQVKVPASRPSVRLDPVFATYASIQGSVVTWDNATPTWGGVGVFTWVEGNQVESDLTPAEYPTYGDLSGGYATYAALQSIVSYDEVTVDDGLIPTQSFSDVAPFGNELRLWRGIELDRPVFLTYESILGIRMSWDLVSASLSWATVDSLLAWDDGNDLPL